MEVKTVGKYAHVHSQFEHDAENRKRYVKGN